MTLPVFVINLDRRPDRWAAMSAQMDRLGIEATRIPAVDARLLAAQEEWEQGTNGNPQGCNLNLGEVACAYSHRKALRAFLDTDRQAALILEDDVELAPDTPSLLEAVDWWPPDAHIIRLENGCLQPKNLLLLWPASAETPSGRMVHRFERFATGTAAYLINREAAAFIQPHLDKPAMPLDHLFWHAKNCDRSKLSPARRHRLREKSHPTFMIGGRTLRRIGRNTADCAAAKSSSTR